MITTFPLVIFELLLEGLSTYAFSKLLPMRFRPLFIILDVGLLLFVNVIGYLLLGGFLVVCLMIAVRYIVPFVLFKGSKPVKVVVVVAGNFCAELSGDLGRFFLTLSTGQLIPEDVDAYTQFIEANSLAYIAGSVVGLCIFFIVASFAATALRRYELAGRANGSWVFASFPAVQILFIVLSSILVAMVDTSIWFLLITVLVGSACVVLDLLIIRSMDNYVRKTMEDERAVMLQKQIDEHLKCYESIVREIESIAKMRHDFRNQAHVALELSERGVFDQARQHIATLKASIEANHATTIEDKKELSYRCEGDCAGEKDIMPC